uniref:Uncharacterized protein n=1 Tax=Candidatus Kentrum sp. UNK TaxID=2126344 RepID=A0A451B6S7_9GAMM|nr:MAG: hypothetical protein BECKUNK1418G_GA0071005_13741 [Candidatus Kentron sp. UNK]VFK73982.1 MAG: hypothetical protein BECKUNK1418H_GA0071006_14191 [Candidatus Kentron sp. UNK]
MRFAYPPYGPESGLLFHSKKVSRRLRFFFGVTPSYKSLAKWWAKIIGYGRRRGECESRAFRAKS